MAYSLEELLRLQEASPSSSASQVRGGTLTPYRPPPPATVNTAPLTNAGGGDDVDGSAFTNFGRFFNANAEKAGAMAQRASDKVQSSGESLQADVKKANSDFYTGLNAGTPAAYGGGTVADENGSPASSRDSISAGGQSLQSKGQGLQYTPPGAITPAEAKARASQTYMGPMGIQGYDGLLARASDLASNSSALTTQAGRQGALSDTYGTGLTSRAGALDSILAGTTGQGRFGELSKRFGGAVADLEDKQTKAQTEAKGAKAWADERGGYYQGELDDFNSAKAKAAAEKDAADELKNGKPTTSDKPKSGVEYDDIPPGSIGNGNFRDYLAPIFGSGIYAGNADKYGKQIWNSMTGKEVNDFQFAGWTPQEKGQFIIDRAKALGIKDAGLGN